MKMPNELREALEKTGLPWRSEEGTKHYKIKLAGRLVAIYPKGKKREANLRVLLNTISQVRRAAREFQH